MPPVDEDPNNSRANTEPDGADREELIASLRALEEELAEILEQRRVDLSRPMRGSERDRLRAGFERQETRLREKIDAIKAMLERN